MQESCEMPSSEQAYIIHSLYNNSTRSRPSKVQHGLGSPHSISPSRRAIGGWWLLKQGSFFFSGDVTTGWLATNDPLDSSTSISICSAQTGLGKLIITIKRRLEVERETGWWALRVVLVGDSGVNEIKIDCIHVWASQRIIHICIYIIKV